MFGIEGGYHHNDGGMMSGMARHSPRSAKDAGGIGERCRRDERKMLRPRRVKRRRSTPGGGEGLYTLAKTLPSSDCHSHMFESDADQMQSTRRRERSSLAKCLVLLGE